jgi:hypothetical protein
VVSLIVGTTCLTKVLMDGSSGLNILYASTLDKMGIPRSNLHPSKAPFYGIILGKEVVPLGRIRLNVTFDQPDNFHKEPLTFEAVDFPVSTMPSWAGHASPSSWLSPTTPI